MSLTGPCKWTTPCLAHSSHAHIYSQIAYQVLLPDLPIARIRNRSDRGVRMGRQQVTTPWLTDRSEGMMDPVLRLPRLPRPLPISAGVGQSRMIACLYTTFARKRSIAGFAWSSAVERNRSRRSSTVCNFLDVLNCSADFAGRNVVGNGLCPGFVTTYRTPTSIIRQMLAQSPLSFAISITPGQNVRLESFLSG